MPQMDGLQLLARIKEMDHLKNVPVIMITTEGGQGKVMEAVQLGATGYVRKPFTADQIKEKLAGVSLGRFESSQGPPVLVFRLTAGDAHPAARPEIGHRDKQKQNQPEDAAQDDHLRQARAVLDVHEEQHDQRCLEDRDRERHENVPAAEVDRRNERVTQVRMISAKKTAK